MGGKRFHKLPGCAVLLANTLATGITHIEVAGAVNRQPGRCFGHPQHRSKDIDKLTGVAIETQHLVTNHTAHIETGIRPEDKLRRSLQPIAATRDQGPEERAGDAVIAQNRIGLEAADVEMAIITERQAQRLAQAAGAGRHESAKRRPGVAVVAKDTIRIKTRHEQIANRPAKYQTDRVIQPAALRRDKGPHKVAGTAVKAQHTVRIATAHKNVVIRAKHQTARKG